ncbi:MAG: HPr(Ser) kinase/phosphatase [Firmicutes bacterium HGW-Firmicutes-1]|jgi:HPr kinase/phosphorylase|nr:MAG: HPr(Ser) kinase/phosphatase [Firmicutes bacterium HGW-Firmicutes-1]
MTAVRLIDIIEKMKLTNLSPNISVDNIKIGQTDVNRPALQLAGFFNYFDSERVQIIGKVEHTYLQTLEHERKVEVLEKLFSSKIPCLILSRELEPVQEIIDASEAHQVPLLQTNKATSYFMSELIRYLKVELAPRISIHGGLVDVFGEGILIMGESGIGKSEAALELIKRGHRLVADDVVEIAKVSDDTLLGTSPEIIRYLIELRGIGIIDCKTLFGVESVKERHSIDLVIKLEDWDPKKEYDRLGLEQEFTEILGNKVICHTIPIRPGRNLSIIVESAAINHRQKAMGYNAAQELNDRVMGNLQKKALEKEQQLLE